MRNQTHHHHKKIFLLQSGGRSSPPAHRIQELGKTARHQLKIITPKKSNINVPVEIILVGSVHMEVKSLTENYITLILSLHNLGKSFGGGGCYTNQMQEVLAGVKLGC